jgi:HEAT repeat protein
MFLLFVVPPCLNSGLAFQDPERELVYALRNKNPKIREEAIWMAVLNCSGSEIVINNLIKSLGDESTSVRSSAASALGLLGQKSKFAILVIKYLIKSLEDESSLVRSSAAIALGHIGKKSNSAIPGLFKLLPKQETRESAFQAIHSIGVDDKKYLPKLEIYLDDPDERVRGFVAQIVAEYGTKAAPVKNKLLKRLKIEESDFVSVAKMIDGNSADFDLLL